MRPSLSLLPTLLLASTTVQAASYSPYLDVTNSTQLQVAAKAALGNLLKFYSPNSGGVFDQTDTPWHESSMIWAMFMDYTKWTGDTSFMETVSGALSALSFGGQQDILNIAQAGLDSTLAYHYNDDFVWPGLALIAGSEIYGVNSTMPNTDGGNWYTPAKRVYDEVWAQWDGQCGGGIFWSRDRNSNSAGYKSTITNLEFISLGARTYIQSSPKDDYVLSRAIQTLDWLLSSGVADSNTGIIADGFNVGSCGVFNINQWTYNYGQFIGSLAWLHLATGDQKYLTLATPFLRTALSTFAPSSAYSILSENCESYGCSRDAKGFKAILVRNIAYLYRESRDEEVRSMIRTVLEASAGAMVERSCDTMWNCGGNWRYDTQPLKNIRTQHVSTALLIATLSLHSNTTGSGLLTSLHPVIVAPAVVTPAIFTIPYVPLLVPSAFATATLIQPVVAKASASGTPVSAASRSVTISAWGGAISVMMGMGAWLI